MANIAKTSFYRIPEIAIAAFERWSGLHVTLHDVALDWLPFVPTVKHDSHRLCSEVKDTGQEAACMNFDVEQLRDFLRKNPEGGSKRCHAGFLEWAVTVSEKGNISAILFAGLRRAGPDVHVDLDDQSPRLAACRLPAAAAELSTVNEEESQLYLEGLRQLAARLETWASDRQLHKATDFLQSSELDDNERRRHFIERFVVERYREPVTLDDLAGELCLSRSRTAHLVREVCGRTFVDQLRRLRLRHAAGMLWQGEKSILEVAMASGFGDVSNFHKAFRKRFRVTPLQFRKEGGIS